MFLLFEENLSEEFHEEISLMKLNHPTLEKFRMKIIESYSNNNKLEGLSNLDFFQNNERII